jgi:hypothetical protein
MKTIVTLLIGLLPLACEAQKFQIGLGGGASTISRPSDPPYLYGTSVRISPCAEIFGSYQVTNRIRVGLKVSIAKLYTGATSYHSVLGLFAPDSKVEQQFIIGSPSFLITPFASYKIGHIYFGAQAGMFTTTKEVTPASEERWYYGGEPGYMAGLHLGFEHKLGKRLSLYTEAKGNFMYLQYELNRYHLYDMHFFQAQLTAGLQFHL